MIHNMSSCGERTEGKNIPPSLGVLNVISDSSVWEGKSCCVKSGGAVSSLSGHQLLMPTQSLRQHKKPCSAVHHLGLYLLDTEAWSNFDNLA